LNNRSDIFPASLPQADIAKIKKFANEYQTKTKKQYNFFIALCFIFSVINEKVLRKKRRFRPIYPIPTYLRTYLPI
jgi:hypothetical protein